MRWALSVDLGERLVSCREDGMTYKEVAETLRVGEATVRRILRLWRGRAA